MRICSTFYVTYYQSTPISNNVHSKYSYLSFDAHAWHLVYIYFSFLFAKIKDHRVSLSKVLTLKLLVVVKVVRIQCLFL